MAEYPNEQALSMAFLQQQPACEQLPEAELQEMCAKAIDIGAGQASFYTDSDINSALGRYKIKAQMTEGGVFGKKLLRAQYDDSVKTVFLYKAGVDSMLETDAPALLGIPATGDAVRKVLLWHEFFHVLEFRKIGLVGKQFPLPGKFLGFSVKKPFYPISEISANAFAMRVMRLRHNPFIVDYLLEQSGEQTI